MVNADDFGMSPGANRAIIELLEGGCVSQTSALATGGYLEDGIKNLARSFHNAIGVHICLDDEFPVAPKDQVRSLIDENGRLLPRLTFLERALMGKIRFSEVETEIRLQVGKLRSMLPGLSHADGHGHIHAFPPIARIVRAVCAEFGIRYVRTPIESGSFFSIKTFGNKRIIMGFLIGASAYFSRKSYYKNSMTSDHFVGLFDSGHVTKDLLQKWLDAMTDIEGELQIVEVMAHPGFVDETPERYLPAEYNWDEETEALRNLPAMLGEMDFRAEGKNEICLISQKSGVALADVLDLKYKVM